MYLTRAKVGAWICWSSIGAMFFYALYRPFPDAWVPNAVLALCTIVFGLGMFILLRNLHAQDRVEMKEVMAHNQFLERMRNILLMKHGRH